MKLMHYISFTLAFFVLSSHHHFTFVSCFFFPRIVHSCHFKNKIYKHAKYISMSIFHPFSLLHFHSYLHACCLLVVALCRYVEWNHIAMWLWPCHLWIQCSAQVNKCNKKSFCNNFKKILFSSKLYKQLIIMHILKFFLCMFRRRKKQRQLHGILYTICQLHALKLEWLFFLFRFYQ